MQRILTFCDVCFLNEQHNHAQHQNVPFGAGNNNMVADLCDDHKKALDDALDPYYLAGRRPDRLSVPKIVQPKKKSKGGVKPTPEGDFACPVAGCPRTFETEQGVSMHKTRVHLIPGVASHGQEAHDAAVAAASAQDVAQGTYGKIKPVPERTGIRAGMSEDALEALRERDRARKAKKREERAAAATQE